MTIAKKIDRFCHLDEDEYWREICAMSEPALRAEHKLIQQNELSASAGLGASGVGGFILFPMWALTAVHARRINVNSRQCDMIERRLAQKGWHGYDIRKRDIALAAGPCVVAELVLPCSSALLSQAAIHGPVTAAASHILSTTTQQSAQVASEHCAQLVTQHMAHQVVDPSAVLYHHVSSFSDSALQGVQSELYTLSNGAVGHATTHYVPCPSADMIPSQAQVLGAAYGQTAALEASKAAVKHGASYAVQYGIDGAINHADQKKNAAL